MFADELRALADLVLPATSYLERDGTMVNLEGRVQRLRRAVIPPCPDELAWIARLAERFGVTIAPDARGVFAELSPKLFGGARWPRSASRPALRAGGAAEAPARAGASGNAREGAGGGAAAARPLPRALLRARPSSACRELPSSAPSPSSSCPPRTRPSRGIENGDVVRVSSNGTSVELRARVNRRLVAGAVRAAAEHVERLEAGVEVTKL